MNRLLGWSLLVAGMGWAAWLDPWSLGERNASLLTGSPRMVARNAQAVVLGMAFLQLTVAQLPASSWFPPAARRYAAGLTAAGAIVYTLGYMLRTPWPIGAVLIPTGALMSFVGFATLSWMSWKTGGSPETGVVLAILSAAMVIDAAMGLFALDPVRFLPAYLGPEDGIRLRMLRLSRAAAVALPILTLLYRELSLRGKGEEEETGRRGAVEWGQISLLCGAIGMPAILTVTAFTSLRLKFLLAIPADLVFLGTMSGVWRASRHASRLEFWGWLLIALSMLAGLLMGLYAFDGPLPAPHFLGAYNDFPRRLARLAHAYCIILGLLSIFVARELEHGQSGRWSGRAGVPLLAAGSVTTLMAIAFLAVFDLPRRILSLGPALVAAGTILCIAPGTFAKRR